MKLFAILIAGLIIVPGQNKEQFRNFHIKDQSVVYSKVFELEGYDEFELVEKFNAYLPTLPGITNVQFNGNVFTGFMERVSFDCRKYNKNMFVPWAPLNYPFYGNVTIQVKDNKYKVVITNIEFVSPNTLTVIDLNSSATKRRGKSLRKGGQIGGAMECLNSYFTDKFTITKVDLENEW